MPHMIVVEGILWNVFESTFCQKIVEKNIKKKDWLYVYNWATLLYRRVWPNIYQFYWSFQRTINIVDFQQCSIKK